MRFRQQPAECYSMQQAVIRLGAESMASGAKPLATENSVRIENAEFPCLVR